MTRLLIIAFELLGVLAGIFLIACICICFWVSSHGVPA